MSQTKKISTKKKPDAKEKSGANVINDPKSHIHIKGARVHNLKNVSVSIPRGKFTVITGLSGSGKSSLAFDTLYAEGQRRYVESLSSYARQFLGRLDKPDVDHITGISPAVAIEQKVTSRTSRSTVGTTTEIYDYLKLLFARIGKTYSPISGNEVKKHGASDVVDFISDQTEASRWLILAPVQQESGYDAKKKLDILLQQGFSRVRVNKNVLLIEDAQQNIKNTDHLEIVIDRITAQKDEENLARIADSAESAFFEGHGTCVVLSADDSKSRRVFSNKFEADGISFEEPSVNLFSFNNPVGACKTCEGFGSVIGIDEKLVIPNRKLSIYQDAIACWKGEKMSEWKDQLILHAKKFDFPIHRPIAELTKEQYELLWSGNKYFSGLRNFFKFIESESYKYSTG